VRGSVNALVNCQRWPTPKFLHIVKDIHIRRAFVTGVWWELEFSWALRFRCFLRAEEPDETASVTLADV